MKFLDRVVVGMFPLLAACVGPGLGLAPSPPAPLPGAFEPGRAVPIVISPGPPVADPTLAIDSRGVLHAGWWGLGFGEIFVAHSADRGATWSEPKNVSNTALGSDFPVLAVGPGDRLYLAWEDYSLIPLSGEIVVSTSDDGGATWSPLQNISQTRDSSSRPSMVVDDQGAVLIAWIEGNEISFTRSTDGGATWTPVIDIAGGHPANPTHAVALATDRTGVMLASWSAPNDVPVLTESRDRGATWSAPVPLAPEGPTLAPSLLVGLRNDRYAAWSQSMGLYTDIVFKRLPDGDTIDISRSPTVPSVDPVLAVDGAGTIVCAWYEVISGNTEVFMARSTDGGRSFSSPLNVSRTPGNSLAPRLVVDRDGAAYVVWEQGVKQAIYSVRAAVGQPD